MTYTSKEIKKMRRKVRTEMEKTLKPNFTSFSKKDLKKMFDLYDSIFFGGEISRKLKEENTTLDFEAGKKGGLGYAGKCTRTQKGVKCFYTLRFPIPLFVSLFTGNEKTLKTGGLICKSRLECLQMTFEHELIHLFLWLWNHRGKGPLYSSHGKLFQCMLFSLFGHTEFRHSLLAGEASTLLTMADMYIGLPVEFQFRNKDLYGLVDSIHKNTVSVLSVIDGVLQGIKIAPSLLKKTTKKVKLPPYLKKIEARKNMRVKFAFPGEKLEYGTITRINQQTASVYVREYGRSMSVPWYFLNKA